MTSCEGMIHMGGICDIMRGGYMASYEEPLQCHIKEAGSVIACERSPYHNIA